MNSIILEARELTKAYKHTAVLDSVNLKLEKGKNIWFYRAKWGR